MEKAATRAKNGEFVNMTDFIAISESEIDTDLEPVLDSEGKLLFRSKKSNRSIDNLLQWMSAWKIMSFLWSLPTHRDTGSWPNTVTLFKNAPKSLCGMQSTHTIADLDHK